MKLFDIVPYNFFSVLSSSNREIYVDALIILHDMFKFELNIRVDDYISSVISSIEDREFFLEDDDELQEGGLTPSAKARLILSRFVKTGWVDKEFLDGSFVEIITPRNYALSVMKLIAALSDNELQEYNSLVFATFSGLKQAKSEHENQLYEAVLSAKSNTEQLQYSLRTLYHGIRGYLRGIIDQNDVNLLLQNHFEEYKRMSDRIYHPIKTMDSVHRYMTPIQNLLSDILADENLMQNMRERAMSVKKYEDEAMADKEVVAAIDYVLDAYQNLSGIVSEIDRKHSAYTKSSIDKIQYLMTADQTIKGKLVSLLKAYAESDSDGQEVLEDLFRNNIRANRQEFLDEKSLYHKSIKSRRVDKAPLAIEQDDTFSGLTEEYLLEHFKKGYPVGRVRAFVDSLFSDGRNSVSSENISITTDADFIMLILATIRQNESGIPYVVQMHEGRIERGGYFIPNMTIRKKEVKSHVE